MHPGLPVRALAAAALMALNASAVAAQTPAQPAPQVRVTGVGYTQFLYQLKDSLGAGHQNQFSVQRAYINVLGTFSGGIQTRVTADIAPTGAGQQTYRLKYAWAGWTPTGSSLTYKLGLINTAFIDFEETLWDYRMQGAIAVDRNGYLTSADFGVGVDGKWNNDQVNGQFTIVNGEGYSNATGDNRKDVQARVSVRIKPTNDASRVGGLRVTGYAGIGKPTSGGTRNRFLGMVSYRSQQITLAAEYAVTKDTVTAPAVPETDGRVISVFGVYRLQNSKVAVIGRFDSVDPNTNVANNRLDRIIAGVSYQLSSNVRLLGNVDLLSYEATPTPLQDATRSRALFQAQFTF